MSTSNTKRKPCFLCLPKQGGETEGATLEIFLSEHRKLREQADKLIAKTQALFALFKGLFHHHALRERTCSSRAWMNAQPKNSAKDCCRVEGTISLQVVPS